MNRPATSTSPAAAVPACRSRRQAGQGMTEYIVIVALIAVALAVRSGKE